jgi:hypothetical protein
MKRTKKRAHDMTVSRGNVSKRELAAFDQVPEVPHGQHEVNCERCKQAILSSDRAEPFSFPSDGRLVHSRCVEQLLREILRLMAAVPDDCRYADSGTQPDTPATVKPPEPGGSASGSAAPV